MELLVNGRSLPAEPDDTILSAMKRAGRMIQSVCGGRAMCGTCRVAIEADWLDSLPPPGPRETRLLRFLKTAAPNHRLACQTVLGPEHDGLAFVPDPPPTRLPATTEKETTP